MASRLSLILRVRSLQCLFEETLLERGEVEIVRSGVERALLVEDAERGDGVQMGVGIQETARTTAARRSWPGSAFRYFGDHALGPGNGAFLRTAFVCTTPAPTRSPTCKKHGSRSRARPHGSNRSALLATALLMTPRHDIWGEVWLKLFRHRNNLFLINNIFELLNYITI